MEESRVTSPSVTNMTNTKGNMGICGNTHKLDNGLLFSEDLKSKLEEFAKSPDPPSPIPKELLMIIQNISETGVLCYDWTPIFLLIRRLIWDSVTNCAVKYSKDASHGDIMTRFHQIVEFLEDVDGCPFTLQRLCEILLSHDYIHSADRLLYTFERLVNVTSVIPTIKQPKLWSPRALPPVVPPSREKAGFLLHLQELLHADAGDGTREPYPFATSTSSVSKSVSSVAIDGSGNTTEAEAVREAVKEQSESDMIIDSTSASTSSRPPHFAVANPGEMTLHSPLSVTVAASSNFGQDEGEGVGDGQSHRHLHLQLESQAMDAMDDIVIDADPDLTLTNVSMDMQATSTPASMLTSSAPIEIDTTTTAGTAQAEAEKSKMLITNGIHNVDSYEYQYGTRIFGDISLL